MSDLEVKEGILLDAEDRPILMPKGSHQKGPRVFTANLSGIWLPIGVVLVPILLFAGFGVILAFITALVLFLFLKNLVFAALSFWGWNPRKR